LVGDSVGEVVGAWVVGVCGDCFVLFGCRMKVRLMVLVD